MTYFVFGGAGSLGVRIVSALLELGHDVTSIDIQRCELPDVNNIIVDLSSLTQLSCAIQQIQNCSSLSGIIWCVRARTDSPQAYLNTSTSIQNELNVSLYPLVSVLEAIPTFSAQNYLPVIIVSSINAALICDQHPSYHIGKASLESYAKFMAVQLGSRSLASIVIVRAGLFSVPERITPSTDQSAWNLQALSSLACPFVPTVEEVAKAIVNVLMYSTPLSNGSIIHIDACEHLLDPFFVSRSTFKTVTTHYAQS